jgi:glycosyltransferase involved in cell wall biosynthesis
VVGFNTAAIPYVVKNGKTGLLARNFKEFIRHLELLLSDENLRKKMGGEGVKFAKMFSWEKAIKEHLDLFEEVLESK